MELLTQELRDQLPKLYSQDGKGLKAVALVKFFTPWAYWTFYASEFDGKDTFFGLIDGHEVELGYFTLSELQAIEGPHGLKVERDLSFQPATLAELKAKAEERR